MTEASSRPDIRKKYSAAIPWQERNLRLKIAGIIGVAWTSYIILSLFNVFFYLGIVIFPITHRAICSGAITCLALLIVPWKRSKGLGPLSPLDVLLVRAILPSMPPLWCMTGRTPRLPRCVWASLSALPYWKRYDA